MKLVGEEEVRLFAVGKKVGGREGRGNMRKDK